MGARRFTGRAASIVVAAVAALGIAGSLGVSAASASTATTTYTKAGTYQFASNESSGPWVVSNSPLTDPSAKQTLGANGVDLTESGTASYVSSAVIVPLGKLSSLFSGGKFVPPAVVGSSNLAYNLYFDTNGNGTYFGWGTADPYTYAGMAGDNAACMGAVNNTSDSADITCFPGQATAVTGLTGTMTMEHVQAAFAARTDGGTKDPEVWAWIGIQTPDQTGYVTSVDGKALVQANTPAPSPSPSASPSSSPSHSGFPTGGVQTGGGKPGTNPLVPGGIAVTVAGLFAGLVITLRRRTGKHSA